MTLKESINNFKREAFPQMDANALATLNKGIEELVADEIEK